MVESSRNKKASAAGVLLGVGLGGFVDGIALHQIAQWHNTLSARLPPHQSMDNMRINMMWDGLFHALIWIITVIGLFMLLNAARNREALPSTSSFIGSLLLPQR